MTAGAEWPARRHLPARIRKLLESLARVVCPPEAAELGLEPGIVARVETVLAALPGPMRAGLFAGLAAYEAGALLDPAHRGKPASALSPAQAEAYFQRWWTSRLLLRRELAKNAKGLLCLACYEMPEMKEALNYTPEAWIARAKTRRLARYAPEVRAHEAALAKPDPLPVFNSQRES